MACGNVPLADVATMEPKVLEHAQILLSSCLNYVVLLEAYNIFTVNC